MPFPWKKAKKNSRISQLVNDHFQNSQKRPGDSSLVVETGFPTSIVDFGIKNGEKLKKLSKKNRAKPPKIPSENENNDPMISQSPCFLPSPSFMPSPSRGPSPSCSPLPPKTRDFDEAAVGSIENGPSGAGRQVVYANAVVVAVVKMFLVVVVTLGTKKFVVGIAISAFSLIFLEYVGKHACKMLKPPSNAQNGLGLVVQKRQRLLKFKGDSSDQKNEDYFDPDCSGFQIGELSSPIQETEIIKPNCVEETQSKKEIMDEFSGEGNSGFQEIDSKKVVEKEEHTCNESELKRRKSRRSKIKSKMKKLVPKKLRSSKQEEHNSESSEISSNKESTTSMSEGQGSDESEDEKESKVMEPNFVEGNQSEEKTMDGYNCKGKLGYQENNSKKVVMKEEMSTCEVSELNRRKSQKDKIKLKMKKLVPKKLRRNGEDNSESSEIYLIREDTISACEEDVSKDKKNKNL